MKKFVKKYFNFIINFISIIMIEFIFKIVNNFKILDWSTFRIILSTCILSYIIYFIECFIPKKVHTFINIGVSLIISIYSLAQTGFMSYIGVYMSLGTSSQLGAVIDYIREFILSFKWYYYLILIPLILDTVFYIFFYKKLNINNKTVKIKNIISENVLTNIWYFLIIIIGISGIYFTTLKLPIMQNKLQTITNRELFNNPSNPSITIKQFGITSFGILDVKNYINPSEEIESSIKIIKKETKKDTTRKYDDTKWNDLIDNETNETLNNLNKYFINNDITDINEYTGYFKDKNLIVIMLESVNDIIINKDDYPNFYKMYNDGWHWSNYYSPRNSCSTGNNEMSGMIGLYSIYNTCTANIYKNNQYFESIFNVFNKNNYYTFSAHDYLAHYYDRDTIHKNMGSQNYYDVKDLNMSYSSLYRNWASDEEFMSKILDVLNSNNKGKYMTWLTTESNHQPYSVSSTEGDKYLDLYNNLDIKSDLKRYKSKLKIVDNALGILVEGLKNAGTLDDTVIVMFGDHYPYGLSDSTINSVLNYDVSVDFETERVPFVIYNPTLEPKEFNKYSSYINLVPTISNLFGLDFDPRLYVGTDILSEDYESMVVFADGSWKNEIAYYNAAKSSVEYFTDKTYSTEELQSINQNIDLKMKMSSLAIKNNYFNYLNNKLNLMNNTNNTITKSTTDNNDES